MNKNLTIFIFHKFFKAFLFKCQVISGICFIYLNTIGRLMKEFHSGKFLLSFDGKLDLYVKRYIFVTVHWQYPAKRVAVNSNIFSYRHDIV